MVFSGETVSVGFTSNTHYSWSSSDTSVVTVDQKGRVTAQGLGSATVTAVRKDDPEKTSKYYYTVKNASLELSCSPSSLTIDYDDLHPTAQMRISDSYGTINYKNWSSSNPNVATVSSSGVVTAYNEGSTRITVSTNEGTASYIVTVSSRIGALYFSYERAASYGSTSRTMLESGKLGNIKSGDVFNLGDYLVKDSRVQVQSWTSSNPAVATVTESGWVTAVGDGETTITVTSTDGKKAECRLLIGQEAQDQYREQVSNSATIGGIVLFVGLGVVVIVAIVTLANAATA